MVTFPEKQTSIWDLYVKQTNLFWIDESIDLNQDKEDLINLTMDEKQIIAFVLVFFKNADELVVENIQQNFIQAFDSKEVQFCYTFQECVENIHQIVYNKTIIKYCEFDPIFNNIVQEINSSLEEKFNWIKNIIQKKDLSIAKRLIYFICIEGILFASSFATIAFFKQQNKLKGLTTSNEFIQRDESIHTTFGIELYFSEYNKEKCTTEEIKEIIEECVELETKIINLSFEKVINISTINRSNMIEYVKYVSNYIAQYLQIDEIYPVYTNPFPFMSQYNMAFKTNFFEKRNTTYLFSKKKLNFEDFKNMI